MNIILKSSSPRRKELLEKAGYSFIVKAYDVDETMSLNKTPYENVKALGLKKALAGFEDYFDDIQIGCDTIVVLDNKIYGKPRDLEDARRILKELSGKAHQVMSGVGIIYQNHIYNFVTTSTVYFKELSDKVIDDYLLTNESMGKAGAYAIQGIGASLIDHYEGSLENIIGLPIDDVKKVIGEIYELQN